ncbi:MAG: hypothetical protein LBV45_00635 [Xanthomonadaceae bacterium]|jgi:hypothetical protein|nr:hypothetical protein [Xanthomonadaceae bacterium]
MQNVDIRNTDYEYRSTARATDDGHIDTAEMLPRRFEQSRDIAQLTGIALRGDRFTAIPLNCGNGRSRFSVTSRR